MRSRNVLPSCGARAVIGAGAPVVPVASPPPPPAPCRSAPVLGPSAVAVGLEFPAAPTATLRAALLLCPTPLSPMLRPRSSLADGIGARAPSPSLQPLLPSLADDIGRDQPGRNSTVARMPPSVNTAVRPPMRAPHRRRPGRPPFPPAAPLTASIPADPPCATGGKARGLPSVGEVAQGDGALPGEPCLAGEVGGAPAGTAAASALAAWRAPAGLAGSGRTRLPSAFVASANGSSMTPDTRLAGWYTRREELARSRGRGRPGPAPL